MVSRLWANGVELTSVQLMLGHDEPGRVDW
jgi:site-specific recombinase XerD